MGKGVHTGTTTQGRDMTRGRGEQGKVKLHGVTTTNCKDVAGGQRQTG